MTLSGLPRLKQLPGPILITGHTGFKGTWATLLLDFLNIPVVGYSLEPTQNSLFNKVKPGNLQVSRLADVRDRSSLTKFLNEVKIDTVFYTQRSVVPYIAPITIENLSKLNSLIYLSLIQIKDLANNLLFIGITPEYAPVDTVLFKLLGHEGVYLDTPAVDNEVWKKKLISSSIKYVDVYSKFCSELNICRNQLGGKWLFVDNDHLSQSGGVLIKLNINKELLVIK